MKYDEIKKEFYKAVENPAGWQHISHFYKKLKNEKSSIVLDVLMSVFTETCKKNSQYQVQEVAGGCLWKLKPKYRRDFRGDIRLILHYWDVSVEELPWYFAIAVGIDVIQKEIESILGEDITEYESKKANTILYWLSNVNSEKFKEELNLKWKKIRG